MHHFCLIGGGNRSPLLSEALQRVDSPRVLLITEACSTDTSYDRKVPKLLDFFLKLGVGVEIASENNVSSSPEAYADKFGRSNVLYTVGGNTPTLLQRLKDRKMIEHIKASANRGDLLSGTSAGALLPFKFGQIDPTTNEALSLDEYVMVPMLGLLSTSGIVHANRIRRGFSESRVDSFTKEQLELTRSAIAIDEGAALLSHPEAGFSLGFSDAASRVHIITPDSEKNRPRIVSYRDSGQFAQDVAHIALT